MIKTKLVAVLTAMVAVLAVSAAPSFANFESDTGIGHGQGKSGPIVLTGGGATLECTSADGEWKIVEGGVEQVKGAGMQIITNKWNGCVSKSSIIKNVAAVVKPCTLELTQTAGQTKAKGSTVTECTVEVKVLGTCIIKVPAGQSGLEKNELINGGQGQGQNLTLTTKAEDTGITTKPNSACLGIKETKEATQKGEVLGLGVKEV